VILGGRILQVSGNKSKDENPKNYNVNVKIDEVKSEKSRSLIFYTYAVEYTDVGQIDVKGELYVDDKSLEKEWKDKKQLPSPVLEEVLTAIMYSGSTIGTLMAFALNLSAPLSMPKVQLQKPESAG
jgi:hypothetical protein